MPAAERQNSLDANKTLFTVMAALNASGYDADAASGTNDALRGRIRKQVQTANPAVLKEIREYFAAHGSDVNAFISLGLSLTPAFEYKVRTVEIPPDAAALDGFRPLLTRFAADARVDDLWKEAQPSIEAALARYQPPISEMVLQVNSYLRNPAAGYLGRQIQIFIELLGAPNQVQTRSYGNDYYVVVTPSTELRVNDIRHAYLHFVLDPLGTKYGIDLLDKRAIGDYAVNAPALGEAYKSDFVLLATECLIKAVETRLTGNAQAVSEALHEGFVLTPFFAEELVRYEKQPQAMRLYFPEMVTKISLAREHKRLVDVQFAPVARVRVAHAASVSQSKTDASPAARTAEEAEQLYEKQELDKARQLYLRALEERGQAFEHARSYYGLARIAIRQNDPEVAERLFQKTLESSPEPQVKAWALVSLGSLAKIGGDREQANHFFENAMSVEGASQRARQEAQKGLEETKQP